MYAPRFLAASLLLAAAPLFAAERPAQTREGSPAAQRTAKAFEQAKKDGPLTLHAFLYRMPKGADLHNHLSGAIYAETWIRDAGEDHLCVDPRKLDFTAPTTTGSGEPACTAGEVEASTVPANQHLYDALIDTFSMRTFVPRAGDSGHDHFFDTFDAFHGTSKRHMGEWLDEIASRAAAQNEQYLELMDTPDFSAAAKLAAPMTASLTGDHPDFAALRQQMIDGGIRSSIAEVRANLDTAEADRRRIEHCGQPDAQPACKVEIRYIYQVLRAMPPATVFAQVVQGLEVMAVDPRFVGMNFVQPEDNYVAMRDYRLHMHMLAALRPLYTNNRLSLHAGELAPGMVPPDGLTFHIREAVDVAGAQRIGHGVDIMYEDRPYELLKTMAAKHVLVEINLTSNDVILNIKGDDHPFELYRKYGVPLALSTDDEGVSRIDLTHEFVRAAVTYPLTYADLKQMARASIEHSFLPGESLWQSSTPETLDRPVTACAGQTGNETPRGACAEFISHSEKAQQQWQLEQSFHTFESSF
ncbi:adenosine deaminase family protein [Silvibacterium dinghuense]|nr:adenosine deaminase [Silvibacterium dinghuense]GGG99686.1 adenosine deaminase [Silvibacterium dinghuense]